MLQSTERHEQLVNLTGLLLQFQAEYIRELEAEKAIENLKKFRKVG